MLDHTVTAAFLSSTLANQGVAMDPVAILALQGYGFWDPIVSTLKGIGIAAAGVGLVVSILIKGAAATNGDRHALAARVAQNVFAGLFLVLLGWTMYDSIVAWTGI